MTRLAILEYPDPRLHETGRAVTVFDDGLAAFADDLVETLHATKALGLSAPQVGDPRRVLALDLSGNASAPEVYVNPEIVYRTGLGFVEESCLSLPGVVANVLRALRVGVRAQDASGTTFERDLEGLHAVCLQHELDHLDGKLFIDRLDWLRRIRARAVARRHRERRATSAAP